MDEITEEEFIQFTESIRAKRYEKDDDIGKLYQRMNGLEEHARQEKRGLTPEEQAYIAELRQQSFKLFEEKYPESE